MLLLVSVSVSGSGFAYSVLERGVLAARVGLVRVWLSLVGALVGRLERSDALLLAAKARALAVWRALP